MTLDFGKSVTWFGLGIVCALSGAVQVAGFLFLIGAVIYVFSPAGVAQVESWRRDRIEQKLKDQQRQHVLRREELRRQGQAAISEQRRQANRARQQTLSKMLSLKRQEIGALQSQMRDLYEVGCKLRRQPGAKADADRIFGKIARLKMRRQHLCSEINAFSRKPGMPVSYGAKNW